MKYYIVALWTSLGPVILGNQNGYDSHDEARAAAEQLRADKIKHSGGLLAILQFV